MDPKKCQGLGLKNSVAWDSEQLWLLLIHMSRFFRKKMMQSHNQLLGKTTSMPAFTRLCCSFFGCFFVCVSLSLKLLKNHNWLKNSACSGNYRPKNHIRSSFWVFVAAGLDFVMELVFCWQGPLEHKLLQVGKLSFLLKMGIMSSLADGILIPKWANKSDNLKL